MGVQAATSGAVHPNGDKVTHPDRHIDPRGRSFKYADDVINYIRTKHNQMSEISYRFTSNDHNTTYYGHESCEYNSAFNSIGHSNYAPCRRYTTKIDAARGDWMQCLYAGWAFGGFDCWSHCRNPLKMSLKEAYQVRAPTPVFRTAWNYWQPFEEGIGKGGRNTRATIMHPENGEGKEIAYPTIPDSYEVRNQQIDIKTTGMGGDFLMWAR